MNPLDKFERALSRVFQSGPGHFAGVRREPIEIRREVLRDIADQVQPAGGGVLIFPFTGIRVELFAADTTQQGALEAIFALPGFADDVSAAISNRGAEVRTMDVQVEVKVQESELPYRIAYSRSSTPSTPIATPRPRAKLVVLQGLANVPELEIDRDLVYIGRLKDVVNSTMGLERRNLLAFDASEATVSRKHARLQYDAESGRFRLYNDPATTSVSRDGRGIPCDATRGVQLRSGDELILGNARVRFEVENS